MKTSSERCPGIGFLSRGDREIGVLRNVEPPTRPRLECLREHPVFLFAKYTTLPLGYVKVIEIFISILLFHIRAQVSVIANKIIVCLGPCIHTNLNGKEAASLLHIGKMGTLWLNGKNTDNIYRITGIPTSWHIINSTEVSSPTL